MPSLPRRAGICRGLILALAGLHSALTVGAAETARAFPLWDGKEAIESYAARVGMPATKSIDLGGGVTLDLVLIPAGQFIMGSAEPDKPTVTVANSNWLIGVGGGAAALLLLVLVFKSIKKRKFSFSLRWLLLMTVAIGLCVGGIARRSLAAKEAARYESELAAFNDLPVDEKPAHSVTLTRPFYMGKYAATQEQYIALMGNNPSEFKGAKLPVVNVSWDDATEFYRKLNNILHDQSLEARLPTEAQWEYACRAGTRTRFYSGDMESDLDSVGWYKDNSRDTVHPVGLKRPNMFGLYDMHGNVEEWCEDAYMDHYKGMEATIPLNEQDAVRVLRGGSWYEGPDECESAYRFAINAGHSDFSIGFRVVAMLSSTFP